MKIIGYIILWIIVTKGLLTFITSPIVFPILFVLSRVRHSQKFSYIISTAALFLMSIMVWVGIDWIWKFIFNMHMPYLLIGLMILSYMLQWKLKDLIPEARLGLVAEIAGFVAFAIWNIVSYNLDFW